MIKFYKFDIKIEGSEEKYGNADGFEAIDIKPGLSPRQCMRIFCKSFIASGETYFIFVSSVDSSGEIEGAVITKNDTVTDSEITDILYACEMVNNTDKMELTVSECDSLEFGNRLSDAQRENYMPNGYRFFESFEPLDRVFDRRENCIWGRCGCYSENVVKPSSYEPLASEAEKIMWSPSLTDELVRIFQNPQNKELHGIPVHYILCSNNYDTRETATEILVSALHTNGRVGQGRYGEIKISSLRPEEAGRLNALFETYKGGTIVFRFNSNTRRENGVADISEMIIETVCKHIQAYRNEVQVIFCFPMSAEQEKKRIFQYLGGVSFITLEEGSADKEAAANYLLTKAEGCGYKDPTGLTEKLTEDRPYRLAELNNLYDNWLTDYAKNVIYPQYANIEAVEAQELVAAPKGKAYDKLQSLIGLTSAKQVIEDAVNYYKAQRLLTSRGFESNRSSMHMVFTGNPGTAKTTCARLFAEIMRDNNILAEGQLVEVGRGDLIGKYVGHTAPLVQSKFKEARGGVLFIDEAYSLVDDKDGLFGDEAINTIVQEMENYRDEVVVIFAGYPAEMGKFLSKNPGLRSRIAFHVLFEDYTADELCRMTELIASDRQMTLGDGVKDKLYSIYANASKNIDFGNGRFVRNMIEKAAMRQATRLMMGDITNITNRELTTLEAEDFVYESASKKQETRKIGFCA